MFNCSNITKTESLTDFGVYKITCLSNSKFYIGSTTQSFWRRLNKHLKDLLAKKHHSSYMQNSFIKYGIDSFIFEIIKPLNDKSIVIGTEQYYIDCLKPAFNVSPTAGSPLGIKRSEAQKIKTQKSLRSCGISSRNSSGHKGVHWNKTRDKWESSIRINNKLKFLGRFENIDDAIFARKEAESMYY